MKIVDSCIDLYFYKNIHSEFYVLKGYFNNNYHEWHGYSSLDENYIDFRFYGKDNIYFINFINENLYNCKEYINIIYNVDAINIIVRIDKKIVNTIYI